jgi:hypothetical protein
LSSKIDALPKNSTVAQISYEVVTEHFNKIWRETEENTSFFLENILKTSEFSDITFKLKVLFLKSCNFFTGGGNKSSQSDFGGKMSLF